jgi:hypothetical protein
MFDPIEIAIMVPILILAIVGIILMIRGKQ